MGSGHLSGIASLSSRYRMALSIWPLPCRAAVRSAEPLPFGETDAERCCWERSEGRLRSVEELEKVCANHPDRRVGRSVNRELEPGE